MSNVKVNKLVTEMTRKYGWDGTIEQLIAEVAQCTGNWAKMPIADQDKLLWDASDNYFELVEQNEDEIKEDEDLLGYDDANEINDINIMCEW